jgi:hypothetical protein
MSVEPSSYFAQKNCRKKNENPAQPAIAANSAVDHASCLRTSRARRPHGRLVAFDITNCNTTVTVNDRAIQLMTLGIVVLALAVNIAERILLAARRTKRVPRSSRVVGPLLGVVGALIGALHGYGAVTHHAVSLTGHFFDAATGRTLSAMPLPQWDGWIAFTLLPDLGLAGALTVVRSLVAAGSSAFMMRVRKRRLLLVC